MIGLRILFRKLNGSQLFPVLRYSTEGGLLAKIFANSPPEDVVTQRNLVEESSESQRLTVKYLKQRTRYRLRLQAKQNELLKNSPSLSVEELHSAKLKKFAILLGYCGLDYYGMQRNKGTPTIEEDLWQALLKARLVTHEAYKRPKIIEFQRASRTDRGVSAARQIVCIKLPSATTIDHINAYLPPTIRLFAMKRATRRFDSKNDCDSRTYCYTLPTFAFEPSAKSDNEMEQFRITPEKIDLVNALLHKYEGTKKYHNFTKYKTPEDPSVIRIMVSCSIDRIFHASNMEFAVLKVHGHSFMLYQIRKMVGMALAVIRGAMDPEIMDRAFTDESIKAPTAPALGLVLENLHYDRYNRWYEHASISWDEADELVEQFKTSQIYPHIIEKEITERSMATWLREDFPLYFLHSDRDVDDDATRNYLKDMANETNENILNENNEIVDNASIKTS